MVGGRTMRLKKSYKGQNKHQSRTAGEKRNEIEYSREHQSDNQRQDPEREGGGGYNENGGAEPY